MDVCAASDSDWAGHKRTRRSTSGGCIWAGGCLVKAWSKTQACVTLSSAEAELVAAVRAASESIGCQSILLDLGVHSKINLGMDSSAAMAMLNRDGLGKSRHIDTQHMWLQEKVRDSAIKLSKIPTAGNPADIFTKPVSEEIMIKHLGYLGYEFV